MPCYSLLYYLSFFTLYWLNALRCRCTLSDFSCIRNWKNSALINEWIWCILMLKLLSAGLTHVLADETGIWMLNTLFAVCLIFKCCPFRPSFPGKMVEKYTSVLHPGKLDFCVYHDVIVILHAFSCRWSSLVIVCQKQRTAICGGSKPWSWSIIDSTSVCVGFDCLRVHPWNNVVALARALY
jgi:hypothetical protein